MVNVQAGSTRTREKLLSFPLPRLASLQGDGGQGFILSWEQRSWEISQLHPEMLLSSFPTLRPDPLGKWWCALVLGQHITMLLSTAEYEKLGLKTEDRGALGCSKGFMYK